MLNQTQIDELIQAATPNVIKTLQASIESQITWQVTEGAAKQIANHVQAWITENIIPEVSRELSENKESLISIGIKLGPAMVDATVIAMTAQMEEVLKSSYKRGAVFKALFGN